jgi:DNA-binding NarL/FixJ family response regulator
MIAAIAQDPRISLAAHLAHPHDALPYIRQRTCDVLVLNCDLPHADAVPIVDEITRSAAPTRVLIFTANDGADEIVRSFRAGIHGYGISTNLLPEDVCAAIVGLARSGTWTCPRTTRRLVEAAVQQSSGGSGRSTPGTQLSRREMEVLRLAASGAREEDIANRLCLTRNTVKTYLRRIREKLKADSRAEAINLALDLGLLPPHAGDPLALDDKTGHPKGGNGTLGRQNGASAASVG